MSTAESAQPTFPELAGPAAASEEAHDEQRSRRWMARQAVMIGLAFVTLAVGGVLLVHGVTLWLDRSAPQVCTVATLPWVGIANPDPPPPGVGLLCHSVGPWRDLAIPLTAVGAALALFGLGIVPASVSSYKRQLVFRGGTWARVPSAGAMHV